MPRRTRTTPSSPAAIPPGLPAGRPLNNQDWWRQTFVSYELFAGTLLSVAAWGALMCVLCYTGWQFGTSVLGKMTLQFMSDICTGYAKMLLPQALVPYAPWIGLSIPGSVLGYNLIYSGLTGSIGLNTSSTHSRLKSLIAVTSVVLPFAGFGLGLSLGLATKSLFWATWACGAIGGLNFTDIGQGLINAILPAPPQPNTPVRQPAVEHDATPDPRPAPGQRSSPSARPILNNFGRKQKDADKLADVAKKAPAKKAAKAHAADPKKGRKPNP